MAARLQLRPRSSWTTQPEGGWRACAITPHGCGSCRAAHSGLGVGRRDLRGELSAPRRACQARTASGSPLRARRRPFSSRNRAGHRLRRRPSARRRRRQGSQWLDQAGRVCADAASPTRGRVALGLALESLRPVDYNYHVFVHLLNANDEKLAQRWPASAVDAPDQHIAAGRDHRPRYGLLLPSDLPVGSAPSPSASTIRSSRATTPSQRQPARLRHRIRPGDSVLEPGSGLVNRIWTRMECQQMNRLSIAQPSADFARYNGLNACRRVFCCAPCCLCWRPAAPVKKTPTPPSPVARRQP